MTEREFYTLEKKTMDEVLTAKSWKKIGKAIQLYSLCTYPGANGANGTFNPMKF